MCLLIYYKKRNKLIQMLLKGYTNLHLETHDSLELPVQGHTYYTCQR